MENTKDIIIKCPHCGGELLLDEVFYRDDFSGKPKNIIRDALGKILYVDYEEGYTPTFEQHYYCELCGKPFIAEAELNIKTRPEEAEADFSETTVQLW